MWDTAIWFRLSLSCICSYNVRNCIMKLVLLLNHSACIYLVCFEDRLEPRLLDLGWRADHNVDRSYYQLSA